MTSQAYNFQYFTVRFPSDHQYVAHVEINRPDKLNAFVEAMWHEMGQIFTQLSSDPSVRSIVLSGAGERAFTTGLDVKAASQGLVPDVPNDPARKAVHLRRYIGVFQDCISAVERCEKPVIVAMHGFALGLAVDLSTAADVRICSRDVQFSVKEADLGFAADIGTLSRLPKVVGHFGWVKEVALTARTFGAEEALRVGFVNAIYESRQDAVSAALKMAALMASKSPLAMQSTKEILNYSRDHTVEEGLRYTAVWNSAALQSKDVPAAMLAGMQKRTPTFEKL